MIVPQLDLIRRRGVTLIRQNERAECGLACVAMIAGYHGLLIDLPLIRRLYPSAQRGASLAGLQRLAEKLGLVPRAIKLSLEDLDKLDLPAILHWDFDHFVVIEKFGRRGALIHDPNGSSRWTERKELSSHFTGVALELKPATEFEVGDHRSTLKLSQLWSGITGLKRAVAQVLCLTVVLEVLTLTAPFYIQIAIDSALPALDLNMLVVAAVGFGALAIFAAISEVVRSFVLLRAGTTLGYSVAVNLTRHLFRLPVEWFDRRHVGDILSRFQSITPIQELLTQDAIGLLLDGGLSVLVLAVMAFYSPLLTVISIGVTALYIMLRVSLYRPMQSATEASLIARAKEQSSIIESLRTISVTRLYGRESQRLSHWQTRLVASINAQAQSYRLVEWNTVIKTLLYALENIISIGIAVAYSMRGGFSVGMIFAFIAYKQQFVSRSTSMVDQIITIRMLRLHLDRISDIALAKQDVSYATDGEASVPFAGCIELSNVSFRYSPDDPWILRDLDLCVDKGDHIAITGVSGGGKSTLARILLGLVPPTRGDVFVDGTPIARFGHAAFRAGVAAVLQEDGLFAGSIAENIAFFDDEPDMDWIRECARLASIDADIQSFAMRYNTLVGDMGSALSGGQKQRVLLARALYRKPKLLLLDEGTAHLDEFHEHAVNKAISELGIARVVIAHRKESLAIADRVLHLVDGRLISAADLDRSLVSLST